MRQPLPEDENLLDFDFGASFLELLFRSFGIGLVGGLENRLRSFFDELLGFGESESGLDFAHDLDDGDLLVGRNRDEDHVEFGLRFGGRRSSASTSRSGGGDGDRRGGGNAPVGFELFDELRDFDDGEFAEFSGDSIDVSHGVFAFRRHPRPRMI